MDFFQTHASVVKLSTIRIALSIVASQDLEMIQADAVSAFLNSVLTEPIYMEQPQGYGNTKSGNLVCKLNKALYGLKQSAYEWRKTLAKALSEIKFVPVTGDDCLYHRHQDGAMLLVYVDDLIAIAKKQSEVEEVIKELSKSFKLKVIGEPKKFLGLEIERDSKDKRITLHQSIYSSRILEKFGMQDSKPAATPMATVQEFGKNDGGEVDIRDYQSMIGSVMYLMVGTRPDLAYAIGVLSCFSANPEAAHLSALKRIFRYIKNTSMMLHSATIKLQDIPLLDTSSCSETDLSHGHPSVSHL